MPEAAFPKFKNLLVVNDPPCKKGLKNLTKHKEDKDPIGVSLWDKAHKEAGNTQNGQVEESGPAPSQPVNQKVSNKKYWGVNDDC